MRRRGTWPAAPMSPMRRWPGGSSGRPRTRRPAGAAARAAALAKKAAGLTPDPDGPDAWRRRILWLERLEAAAEFDQVRQLGEKWAVHVPVSWRGQLNIIRANVATDVESACSLYAEAFEDLAGQDTLLGTSRPAPVLHVHPTAYRYDGDADPSRPGGMTAIYQHLAADEQRASQIIADVLAALRRGRNCLVLTNRTSHLETPADMLREAGHDPVILRGGMGAKSRAAALARLQPQTGGPPLLAVATGSYAGEGFDCPALDTLFLASPVASKGSLTQYVGRILRTHENKTTAEVHDYLDARTGVLAAMLAKRAPGYTGLGFCDPRKLALTPSASTDSQPAPGTPDCRDIMLM